MSPILRSNDEKRQHFLGSVFYYSYLNCLDDKLNSAFYFVLSRYSTDGGDLIIG